MLHEDDDPLSSSIFNSTLQSSFMDSRSTTMQSSLFGTAAASHYEDVHDPWGGGGFDTTNGATTTTSDISRSWTTPNLNVSPGHTNGHMDGHPSPNAAMVLGKKKKLVLGRLSSTDLSLTYSRCAFTRTVCHFVC